MPAAVKGHPPHLHDFHLPLLVAERGHLLQQAHHAVGQRAHVQVRGRRHLVGDQGRAAAGAQRLLQGQHLGQIKQMYQNRNRI